MPVFKTENGCANPCLLVSHYAIFTGISCETRAGRYRPSPAFANAYVCKRRAKSPPAFSLTRASVCKETATHTSRRRRTWPIRGRKTRPSVGRLSPCGLREPAEFTGTPRLCPAGGTGHARPARRNSANAFPRRAAVDAHSSDMRWPAKREGSSCDTSTRFRAESPANRAPSCQVVYEPEPHPLVRHFSSP